MTGRADLQSKSMKNQWKMQGRSHLVCMLCYQGVVRICKYRRLFRILANYRYTETETYALWINYSRHELSGGMMRHLGT